MIAEFHEEDTKVIVEVDGVRGVLIEVGDVKCEGCTLFGFCHTMHGAPCRVFSGSDNYMFVQESRLKEGGTK